MSCVEPSHEEHCSFRSIVELGVTVLVGLVEIFAAILIASIRTSGSSEMHSRAVIPRMGRGRKTGGAMYFWVPVAGAAVVSVASGGLLVSSVDAAPL